ncbi:DUF2939 domain-containing protein [Ideonella sp. B7]|uniref:DUF2939 domain-containing protein n=1 Tax=Ideonella benzenivorans TaxID=2831643 RepID=UPI001CED99F1|nr:DUF2939 domain-containing protein [Ideonella benzenivorans]MCA6216775.1 DUF2939 domain-containing protein [Ideonella benzenivorans]
MRNRLLASVLAVLALVLVGYWYASPYLTLRAMRSAAQARDADRLNAHVDYPRVRDSLKGQFSAMLARNLGGEPGSQDAVGQAGAALGAALGMALGDRLIDALVQPEMVMRALTQAQVRPQLPSPSHPASVPAEEPTVDWTTDRVGLNKLVVYGHRREDAPDDRLALVFERSGFADWKLTEIRLSRQDQP